MALTLTEFGFVVSELTTVVDGALSEGEFARYSIYLRSPPLDTVTMRVILPPNLGITLTSDPEELIFSTENWGMNQPRFVTVSYVDDELSTGDRTLEIAHIAVSDDPDWDSGGDPVAVVGVDSIDDEDLPRLRLLLSNYSAVEGDGGSDGSQRPPTIEVMVTAELEGPARTEETIVSLSFGRNGDTAGPGDYTATLAADAFLVIPQRAASSTEGAQHSSVAVTLTLNRDFIDEEDETFAIIGRAAGLSDGSATFTIIDHPDDERGIEIGEIPPDVTEGGAISYTLVLRSRPLEEVRVYPVYLKSTRDEVALSPSPLVFSTTNWHIPQDITVSAIDDLIAEGPRDVTITYVVVGGDYYVVQLAATTVRILDDDAASTRVVLSLDRYSAAEGEDVFIEVTAMLDASPRLQATTVTLSLQLDLDADAADVELFFLIGETIEILIPSGETTGSIGVDLELTNDKIDDGGERFTIHGSVDGLENGSAIFTITDDDRRGILVSPTTLTVMEGAGSSEQQYSVKLLSQPTTPVTVTFAVMVAEGVGVRLSDIFLNGQQQPFPSLLFTPENWFTPQSVGVVVDNDHIQQRVTTVTIDHVGSGGDYAGLQASATVNVTDDELEKTNITLSLLDESMQNRVEELEEGGGPLTVYVAAEIGTALYVDAHMDLTDAGGTADSADYTLTPVGAPLLIRAGETRGTATFTLTLNDDRIDEDTETVEIVGNASGDVVDFIASITGVSFRIIDDDTRSVIVTSPVTVSEGGGRRSYTVRLGSQPDGGDVVEVRITDVSRAPEDEGQGRSLRFFPNSSATAYGIISEPNGDFAPVGEGIVLIFTAADWFEEQAVYVELPTNNVVQDDSEATVTHEVSGGGYDNEPVPDVVLKLRESGFFVSNPTPATVSEGESATYGIRLASRPAGDVVVSVRLPPNPGITLSTTPEVLTFTTKDWDETQSVTVTYEGDDLSTGSQTLLITHTADSPSDTNYKGASVPSVRLNFRDDEGDLPSIRLLLSPSEAYEGDRDLEDQSEETFTRTISVEVTAVFDGFPRSTDTVISLSLGLSGNTADPSDYSATLSSAAFLVIPQGAAGSAEGAQQHSSVIVMLTLVQDHIDEDDEFFTLIAVDNAGILAETSTVFTILDDDSAGIAVTPEGPRRLRKGQIAEYSVVLTSKPEDEVTVNIVFLGVGDSRVVSTNVDISPRSLSFNGRDWFVPQAVRVTAVDDSMDDDPRFGEGNIVFRVKGAFNSEYDGLSEEVRTLEIIDVDATLGRLQLMAGGEEIALTNLADDSTGFMSDDREYSATIPFDVNQVTITAAPNVTETLMTGDQEPGEVRIFGTNLPRDASGEGEPGAELMVTPNLSGEDDFTFFVEVSVLVDGEDPFIETYTLTLTRALPATVELKVFRADDEDRQNPLNDDEGDDTLIFGPEDEAMELVFVLTDGTNYYSISELLPSGVDDIDLPITITSSSDDADTRDFMVEIDLEETRTIGTKVTFETKVTLSRVVPPRAEDFEFSLAFEAMSPRPIAADADALLLNTAGLAFSAEIDVFLEDNTLTNTEISVTYRGHSQKQVETLTPTVGLDLDEIRVSDNGTVKIDLEVMYESGGMRSFEQGSFTFSVVPAPADDPRVTLEGGILKIDTGGEEGAILVEVSVAVGEELASRGFNDTTDPLSFNVIFEHPTAEIQPVAEPDPVLGFTDPLFVFVDKPKELPLETVLAGDSTPLDDSGDILGGLALTLTLTTDIPGEEITATVSIIAGDAESGSPGAPGRSLLFEVAAVKNNVDVEVYVADADQDPKVTVAPFSFKTHFLSLKHEDEIQFPEVGNRGGDFAPDFEVITVSLAGEDPAGERWTLSVANSEQLEGDGHYSVEEVIFVTRTIQVNEIVRKIVTTETETVGGEEVIATTTIYMRGTERVLLDGEVIEPAAFVEVDTTTLSADVWAFLSASLLSAETKTLVATMRKGYRPLTAAEMGEDRATRSLRITRLLPEAEDSRVVLRFDYYLPGVDEPEGSFYRTVDIDTGLAAELRVEVTPDSVVVAKGGTGEVTLVVSNLSDLDLGELGEYPGDFITIPPVAGVTIDPPQYDAADLSLINRRLVQTLHVSVDEDADRSSYEVNVIVRLRGEVLRTKFTVDVNDPPRYEGDRRLTVYESDRDDDPTDEDARQLRTKTILLTIVDPDGGIDLLDPAALTLEVVGFDTELDLEEARGSHNNYFNLSTSAAVRVLEDEADPDNTYQRNYLAVTLTLVGKLAMPYGSVVELRLSGVDDGYDSNPNGVVGSLFVRVEDVAPVFKLATTTVAVLLDEELRIPFESFLDGSSGDSSVPTVLVVEAPDDLLVRVDEADGGAVTLLRLNSEQEGLTGKVKLVVLDSSGGRTELTITVERPLLLPEIVPPNPLLLPIGQMRTLQAELAADTEANVLWSLDDDLSMLEADGIEAEINSTTGELSLTAAVTALEAEHQLTLVADDGNYRRRETLFVAVVAAEPKPRLKLSLLAPDDSGESATIATLTPVLTAVSLRADLEGALPPLDDLKGSGDDSTVTFQITIERRRGDDLLAETTTVATVEVGVGADAPGFSSFMKPIGEQLASLSLAVGDYVSLSIEHWKNGVPTDDFIVGDTLVLPVLEEVIFDRDNDGLDDSIEPDPDNPDPGVLGSATASITAEFAEVGANEVSLSLGNVARSLALAECGGVSLALTVDEDGSVVTTGCGGETRTLAATLTNRVMEQFDTGTYQLFDLLATFDSGQAGPDAFLLITMPLPPAEPQTEYRVYRYDFDEEKWVPVVDAGLSSGSGSGIIGGPGIQGTTHNGNGEESFYAFDFDRDGSVPLLLLVETVSVPEEAPNLEVDSMYQDRVFEITAGMTVPVTLVGLAASFTVEVAGSLNVSAEVQTETIDGSVVYSAVNLTGLKRTKNGPEEVVIVAFDGDNAVASTTLYVAVANQAPDIEFFRALSNGEPGEQITTTFELDLGSQMEVIVVIDDHGDDENFVLGLTGDGGGIAEFVPGLGLDDQGVAQVTNILILTAGDKPSAPSDVSLTATDPSDDSTTPGILRVCVLNASGRCPAASGGGGGGGDDDDDDGSSSSGGGGGSGLLWLFLAAPAVLARLRRRRAARVRSAAPAGAGGTLFPARHQAC